jgi:ketosteroid isomerase-like protein
MQQPELAARLDAIESRQAIDALIAKYALAFDHADLVMLATIWHEDACLLLGDFGNSYGRDVILAAAQRNMQKMPHMHHWMANALITIDGDRATGIVAADCLFFDLEMGPVQVSGEYRDVFSRREGTWVFDKREFETHFVTPLPGWKPIAGAERFSTQAVASPAEESR